MKLAVIIFFRVLGYGMLMLCGAGVATHASIVAVLGALALGHLSIVAVYEAEKP